MQRSRLPADTSGINPEGCLGVKVHANCLIEIPKALKWGGSQVAKATDCKSVTRGFDSRPPLLQNAGFSL